VIDLAEVDFADAHAAVERFENIQRVEVLEPGAGVEIALNAGRQPLDTPDVRLAVFSAWDLETAMLEIWDGYGPPSTGLNTPFASWLPDFYEAYGGMFGNVAEANRLLNGAELAPSDGLTIRVGEFGERFVDTALSLADALNGIGLATEVEHVTTRLFAEDVWLGGDYDIAIGAGSCSASITPAARGIQPGTQPQSWTHLSCGRRQRQGWTSGERWSYRFKTKSWPEHTVSSRQPASRTGSGGTTWRTSFPICPGPTVHS
jgi:ABC-type transport system substrate-binding protein